MASQSITRNNKIFPITRKILIKYFLNINFFTNFYLLKLWNFNYIYLELIIYFYILKIHWWFNHLNTQFFDNFRSISNSSINSYVVQNFSKPNISVITSNLSFLSYYKNFCSFLYTESYLTILGFTKTFEIISRFCNMDLTYFHIPFQWIPEFSLFCVKLVIKVLTICKYQLSLNTASNNVILRWILNPV